MTKLCQIIVAEGVEQIPGPNSMMISKLIQPITTIRLPFLPSALSFHLMVITSGFDLDKGLTFGYKVIDKDGSIIFEYPNQPIPPLNQKFDNFNFNIDAKNLSFMFPGVYTIVVNISGEEFTRDLKVVADKVYKYDNDFSA